MKLDPSDIAKSSAKDDEIQLGCHMKVTVAANQGGRKYMEDRVHVETIRNSDGSIRFTFLGVFDGHGGFEASDYVRRHLLANIMSSELFESELDDDVLEAIKEGFLTTHEDMTKVVDTWPRTASGYKSTAGTTCSVAIIRNGKLYTGHVGDSAIFLGSRCNKTSTRLVTERLTVDHKPESLDEHARIELAGGKVAVKSGISRVVWTRPARGHTGPVRRNTPMECIPFLAVARSLGDLWSFCEDTNQYVVSPEPDLAVRELTEDDAVLVLVSDGITNVLAPMQIMRAVEEAEASKPEMLVYDEQEGRINDRQPNHARRVIYDALKRWNTLRADNLSSIVVLLDPPYIEAEDYQHCVDEVLKDNESIDEMLLMDPESMIHVTPSCTQKLLTTRTPLLYEGTLDGNFCSVDYRGPGFMTHDEEEEIQSRILLKQKARLEEEFPIVVSSIAANVILEDSVINDLTPASLAASDLIDKTNVSEERKALKRDLSPSKENVDYVPVKKVHTEELDEVETEEKEENDDSDEEEPTEEIAERAEESGSVPAVAEIPCTPTTSQQNNNNSSSVRSIKTRSAAKIVAQPTAGCETPKVQRKIAVAARRLSLSTKNTDSPVVSSLEITASTETYSIVTRSRDRKHTDVPAGTSLLATPLPIGTPRSALFTETGSRKRPSRLMQSAGVTPALERFSIASPALPRTPSVFFEDDDVPQVRSEPSTPAKACPSPMNASSWSLDKVRRSSDDDDGTEPPSKIRRIYGFVRRLVGLGTPA